MTNMAKNQTPHRSIDPAATVERVVHVTTEELERRLIPIRREVWRRYPALSILLVTIGVTATFTGIEQLLLSVDFLRAHPVVILGIGVLTLSITGTVYKKLG